MSNSTTKRLLVIDDDPVDAEAIKRGISLTVRLTAPATLSELSSQSLQETSGGRPSKQPIDSVKKHFYEQEVKTRPGLPTAAQGGDWLEKISLF